MRSTCNRLCVYLFHTDANTVKTTRPRISLISSLFRCEKYLEGFCAALAQISNPDEVEILLLHNEPTPAESAIIKKWIPSIAATVRHIIVPEREGLYRTWNRGIVESSGKYLAIWNVDDVRSPHSLELQAACLSADPSSVLCYGSYIGVQNYGDMQGTLYEFPDYNQREFMRSCYLTPFPMWKKSVHDAIGYFDESFRSAGDYDFQIRAARFGNFVRCKEVCGLYLEAPESGISKSGDINNIERTVCEWRYASFDKINLLYLSRALKYNNSKLKWSESQHSLSSYFTDYYSFRFIRFPMLIASIFRLPINVLRLLKHKFFPSLKIHRRPPDVTLTDQFNPQLRFSHDV